MNFKEILSKIKKLLTWWKQRDLTLMGKIQLMKIYAYSKLIYITSLMPVPEWVHKQIEEMCFDFLWKGKDKIKKSTVILDYQHGGLKMMNFRFFVKAQRIMWIKRLITGSQAIKWKQYFKYLMRPMGGNLIFYCNYWRDKVEIMLPTFYESLLKSWKDMKEYVKTEERYRGNEIMYNNKYIQLEGQTLFDEKLFLKNIYRLHHICDEQGDLKPEAYFTEIGLSREEIIKVNKIYTLIPYEWKQNVQPSRKAIHCGLSLEFIFSKKVFKFEDITSKMVYNSQINRNVETNTAFCNLMSLYNISEREVEKIFVQPRICTLNSKLREFQFKLLHKIIYTNHHLHRFKFHENGLCSYCKKFEETYQHVFFDCSKIKELWRKCADQLNLPILKELSWKEIHIGIIDNTIKTRQLLNHILILIKFTIFHRREKGDPPNAKEIIDRLIENRNEEKKIAMERDALSTHLKKWEALEGRQWQTTLLGPLP